MTNQFVYICTNTILTFVDLISCKKEKNVDCLFIRKNQKKNPLDGHGQHLDGCLSILFLIG